MKKVLLILTVALFAVVAVLVVRTLRFSSLQPPVEPAVQVGVDADEAASRFAGALAFQTVSHEDPERIDSSAFLALHDYLIGSYPLVHAALTREVVSGMSLLYTWPGSEPDLSAVVLMGHLDVVPVDPGTEQEWTNPPFAGAVSDGYVWGRGSMDDKSTVISVLEAVEALLRDGFRPARTVHLAFGHDEELGGQSGARVMAEMLAVRTAGDLAFVIDEGGAIADGVIPMLDGPVALVGIAEKGFVSLELRAEGGGGHSSTPPTSTNVGIISRAITRLEQHPFPLRLDGATLAMLRNTGPETSFFPRMAFANLWLFGPIVRRFMASSPEGAAMVRTTTAATMFDAGVKDNVLPIRASAVVNFRILPGETVESVRERVREVIGDSRVEIGQATAFSSDPSPVSDPESAAFGLLARTIRQTVADPDLVVTPYLVMGGTDARYYCDQSDAVYRFLPARIGAGDMARAHGTDERLAVTDLEAGIRFYYQLIRNLQEL